MDKKRKEVIKSLIVEGHYEPPSVKKLMFEMLEEGKINELLEHIAGMSSMRISELIITHNKIVAKSLKWFVGE